jgi:hypothetical protein
MGVTEAQLDFGLHAFTVASQIIAQIAALAHARAEGRISEERAKAQLAALLVAAHEFHWEPVTPPEGSPV